jgi:hypothetical protein
VLTTENCTCTVIASTAGERNHVRKRFGGNGTELSDAIADAFDALYKELE